MTATQPQSAWRVWLGATMSGFNALAARLARSRRKLEQERAVTLAKAIADEGQMPEFVGVVAKIEEAAHLQRLLPIGGTNVIVFPRR
jgi:hypothetical protein